MEKIYFVAAIFLASAGLVVVNYSENNKPEYLQLSSSSTESTTGRLIPSPLVDKTPSKPKNEAVIFNDPAVTKNWGLASANAIKAWNVSQGSRDVVVAVIDTGIDVNHQDLKNNLWKNPGETGKDSLGRDKATNGIDDDKNGFVDDVHGWNFVSNNHKLDDNHGHGTHIAGIIGAEGGNGFGITGVSPKVSLMVLKYYDPAAPGNNLVNTIKAIEYAVQMNAKIINYSGGGLEYSAEEYRAVKKAEAKGILFVAAAGNERSNSDISKYYPANYELENIISVTAINPNNKVLSSSNYGSKTVDIAAPGENIYSTAPGNSFFNLTGTSQATAFVSGLAALLMAHNSEFNAYTVKKYILKTGDSSDELIGKTGTAKQLNIFRALTSLDQGVNVSGVIASNVESNKTNYSEVASADSGASNAGFLALSQLSQKLNETFGKSETSEPRQPQSTLKNQLRKSARKIIKAQ